MAGRGYNTIHGYDSGPAPPGFGPGQRGGMPNYPAYYAAPAVPAFGWPVSQPAYVPPVQMPPMNYPQFSQYPQYPGFAYASMTHPVAPGAPDHGYPGIHLRNHTGGLGLPPGYDYAFPPEHCKIHVFKTPTPPWQTTLFKEDSTNHVKLFVPTTVTVKELMQQLGANNKDGAKNKLYEITEIGNGRWAKGLAFKGGEPDKDRIKKPISDYGWDKSRTGSPGERPVVWLWVTKD